MSDELNIPILTVLRTKTALKVIIDDIGKEGTQGFFLWGPPGIGKSDLVKQVAIETGRGFRDVRLGQLDPVDLRGLPVFDHENKKSEWYPPSFLPDTKTEEKGILFLDEINTAAPAVQAAAYQLILDRAVGDYKMPPNWIIIAAGNRRSDQAIAYKLPSPLANRFTHIEVTHDADEWRSWAYANNIDPFIIGFIQFQPDALFNFDGKTSETAFPTPRSWAFSSTLQRLRDEDLELYNALLGGTVGKAASQQFIAYLTYRDTIPSPIDILEGKEYIPPETPDAMYVLMAALIAELMRSTKTKFDAVATNFMKYVSSYENTPNADHGIVLIKELIRAAGAKKLPVKTSTGSTKGRLKAKTAGNYISLVVKNDEYRNWQKRNGKSMK